MHNYEFSIGDYRRDTMHLSLLEHGIYRSLLDTYYLNECPFTEPEGEIMRKHGVRSQEEVNAFNRVINDFFQREACGYLVHIGCTKRLERVYKKSAAARKNAEKRWQDKIAREKKLAGEGSQAEIFDFPQKNPD